MGSTQAGVERHGSGRWDEAIWEAGSPSSSTSSCTLVGSPDREQVAQERVSHWCALSTRGLCSADPIWCRRLFVMQWAIDSWKTRQFQIDDVWRQLSSSFSGSVQKYFGCRYSRPGRPSVLLYRFIVLLKMDTVGIFASFESADELLPAMDGAVVAEDCWTQIAPCDVFMREQFLASWILTILTPPGVVCGERIEFDDVGLGGPSLPGTP